VLANILLPLAIDINIDPEIGKILGFTITWHGLFSAVGIAVGVSIAYIFARRRGIPEDEIYNIALLIVVGGIIGARTLFVLEHLENFRDSPLDVFRINEGGISIYGALIGGALFGTIYVWLRHIPFHKGADAAALGAIVGMAIGRIGDVINGEHHASESTLPWAVRYVHPNTQGELDKAVHPAVGYELLGDLLIFAVLLLAWRYARKEGYAFYLWVFLYGLMRFFVSFLRSGDILVVGGLRMAQLIALAAMVGGLAGLYYLASRRPLIRAERRRRARLTRSR